MYAKCSRLIPAFLIRGWFGGFVMLLGLHVALGADSVAIAPSTVREFLTHPPYVHNCVFRRVLYSRGGTTNLFQFRYQDGLYIIRQIASLDDVNSTNSVGYTLCGRSEEGYWSMEFGRLLLLPNQKDKDKSPSNKELQDLHNFVAERYLRPFLDLGINDLQPGTLRWKNNTTADGMSIRGTPIELGIEFGSSGQLSKLNYSVFGYGKDGPIELINTYDQTSEVFLAPGIPGSYSGRSKGSPDNQPGYTVQVLVWETNTAKLDLSYFKPGRYARLPSQREIGTTIIFSNGIAFYNSAPGKFLRVGGTPPRKSMLAGSRWLFALLALAIAASTIFLGWHLRKSTK